MNSTFRKSGLLRSGQRPQAWGIRDFCCPLPMESSALILISTAMIPATVASLKAIFLEDNRPRWYADGTRKLLDLAGWSVSECGGS